MSDLNTTTALSPVAGPKLDIQMSFTPHLETGAKIMPLSAYVTPVGFDAAKAGPSEAFCGAAVDISQSMEGPIDKDHPREGRKDQLSRDGTEAFLSALPPNFYFALYTIGRGGRRIFPTGNGLPVKADAKNIAAAKAIVRATAATDSDTNMEPSMRLFREDAIALQGATGINTAILGALTDGGYSDGAVVKRELGNYKVQREKGLSLAVLPFGIGLDWNAEQLRLISDSTMSPKTPELLMNAAKVTATFKEIVEIGAAQTLSNVKLIIKKAASVPLLNVSVQKPVSINLQDKVVQVDDKTIAIHLGSWDNETRLFYAELGVQQPQGAANLTACFLSFQYDIGGKTVTTPAEKVVCTWTDDANLSSVIARGVNAAQGIEGSKVRMRQAAELASSGGFEKAEVMLSEQYRKAKEAGQEDVIAMLLQHVDVVDDTTGTVRMKNRSAAGAMDLNARSGDSTVRRRG